MVEKVLGGCGWDKNLKIYEGSHRPTTWEVKQRTYCDWVFHVRL